MNKQVMDELLENKDNIVMYVGLYNLHGDIIANSVNVGYSEGENYCFFQGVTNVDFGFETDFGIRDNFEIIKKILENEDCIIEVLPDITESWG